MKVDMKEIFRSKAITVEFDESRALGVPITAELLDQCEPGMLDTASRQKLKPGDMLLAIPQPGGKKKGVVINLGVENDLVLLVPDQTREGEFTRFSAQNSMQLATEIETSIKRARIEEARNAEAFEKATAEHEARLERGLESEAPVLKQVKNSPADLEALRGFIVSAHEASKGVIATPYLGVTERVNELYSSRALRAEQREQLSHDERARLSEAREIRGKIAELMPEHPDALRSTAAAIYDGEVENVDAALEMLSENRINANFNRGILASAPGRLGEDLVASFTTMKAVDVPATYLSTADRRRFEQLMARHEDTATGHQIAERVDAVMNERMPGYRSATPETASRDTISVLRFFSKDGADFLLNHDIGQGRGDYSAMLIVSETAARVADFDIKAHNRIDTVADVPSKEELARLKVVLNDLSFDNNADADVNFDFDDDIVDADDDIANGPQFT